MKICISLLLFLSLDSSLAVNMRAVLRLAALGVALGAVGSAAGTLKAIDTPNFIILFADDMGYSQPSGVSDRSDCEFVCTFWLRPEKLGEREASYPLRLCAIKHLVASGS